MLQMSGKSRRNRMSNDVGRRRIDCARSSTVCAVVDLRSFLQTVITLASASLGLVAALAWNDAIKAAITKLLGSNDSLAGLFAYAVLATMLAIIVVVLLGRAAARLGGEAKISREVD
jgi:hypothetical protein